MWSRARRNGAPGPVPSPLAYYPPDAVPGGLQIEQPTVAFAQVHDPNAAYMYFPAPAPGYYQEPAASPCQAPAGPCPQEPAAPFEQAAGPPAYFHDPSGTYVEEPATAYFQDPSGAYYQEPSVQQFQEPIVAYSQFAASEPGEDGHELAEAVYPGIERAYDYAQLDGTGDGVAEAAAGVGQQSPRDDVPAPPSAGGSIARHKLLVLLCALVLGLLGAAAGAARQATYSATATLQVGRVNPNSPGFYGFVQSASDLATAFSRAITAAPVLRAAQRHMGLSPAAAAARLSAEPIPNSPAFRVVASGPSARDAVRLANLTSRALITYEAQSNTYDPDTQNLLAQYRAASLSVAHASALATQAAARYARTHDPLDRESLESAQAARASASLQAQAVAGSYQLSAQSTTTGLISMLAAAATATSDHRSKIELLGFIGLLGGLVIGCAIALLVEQRHATRPSDRRGREGDWFAEPPLER